LIEPIYEYIYLLTHFIYGHIYCSLINISLLITGLRHEKYDTYGKVCTEMFVVNVRSMHVLPRFVDFWQFYHLDIALASGTLYWCRRGCFIVAV